MREARGPTGDGYKGCKVPSGAGIAAADRAWAQACAEGSAELARRIDRLLARTSGASEARG